jgi:trigger factor
MKVKIESKKGLKTKLNVFIDKKTIDEKIVVRLLELSRTVNLKGFRPGKVPTAVLKRQFGKAVYGEVLEKILKESSTKAIEENKIKVAGQPKLDLKSHGEDKDLEYTLEIDELPAIKLQALENIKYTNYEIKVEDKEIKKRIEDIAKNQDNFKDKNENETAVNGDLVVFDYDATIENKNFEGGKGKNTQIVLGKDLFIKGFDKQLLGCKKNQIKEVSVILPENYPKKEFANKNAIFKCKILNVKKSAPTNIDDQFAKSLGAKDLNNLKEMVIQQTQNQYKMSLDATSKENILKQIEQLHKVDIPENLVEQELSLITQNLKKEDIEKNIKKNKKIATKRIKLGLILNELGEKNNLKVEEQELKNEIRKQIQTMPDQQKQVTEYYQKNPSAASSLRGSIYEEKILNFIKSKSKVMKKTISLEEAENILKIENDQNHDHDHNHESSKKSKNKTLSKSTKKIQKSTSNKKKIRKKQA